MTVVVIRDGEKDELAVNRQLGNGEHVLWRGCPVGPRWLERQDVVMLPFSLLWGFIVLGWEVTVLVNDGTRNTILFPLFGIPFVILAIYLLVVRLFVRRWMRARTVYAVTDQRAISIAPSLWGGRERLSTIWLASHPNVKQKIGRGGNGTIYIGSFLFSRRWAAGDPSWPASGWGAQGTVTFANIKDAFHVYELLNSHQFDQAASATGGHR